MRIRIQCLPSRLADVPQIQHNLMVIHSGRICCSRTQRGHPNFASRGREIVRYAWPGQESRYADGNARARIPSIALAFKKHWRRRVYISKRSHTAWFRARWGLTQGAMKLLFELTFVQFSIILFKIIMY